MSRIDAVIPTFNAPPERLHRAVASALACPDIARVIVIDDGSTAPVASEHFGPDPHATDRLELVCQDNAGPSSARNRGLSLLRADYAWFLDDDDEAVSAGLHAMLELADSLNAAAVVAARINVFPDGRQEQKDVPPEWARRKLPDPADVLRPIALFGASGLLVHRRIPAGGLLFDETLRIGEDRDFLRRVAAVGAVGVCADVALRVTIHDGGVNLSSPSHMARRIRDHLVLLDRYKDQRSQAHLRNATAWLVNAASKARVDRDSWSALVAACRQRRWGIPLKSRLRRILKPAATP